MSTRSARPSLAVNGGSPVYRGPWPKWPRVDQGTERAVLEVLRSGRWSITGPSTGRIAMERRFATAFADFHEVPFCVPTSSGSSALTIALAAVGVRPGTEVLVPSISWVACAAAVVALGAVPVLVDVASDSLCMDVDAASAAITERTAAILLVHQHGSIADISSFCRLAASSHIALVEDCSQAHGAVVDGRRVGTFGDVAAFSMQTNKLLACGEGGATITRDPAIHDRLQQLRANGRRHVRGSLVDPGHMELEEVGTVFGRNFVMPEFQAAILLDRLPYLDEENRHRRHRAEHLQTLLADIPGVDLLVSSPPRSHPAYHKICFRLHGEAFGRRRSAAIARVVTAEIGFPVTPLEPPLSRHVLYAPFYDPLYTLAAQAAHPESADGFPRATAASESVIYMRHHALLATADAVAAIAAAFHKASAASDAIPN